ncbi:hypothetical protein O1611_g2159 [Lasiodiplodia mahajangana]|uniref:Uncharacterized protein n=1 Tax=Lasiodiplodia mahajangana TaxID=1108764 RepID=A0ACC2JVC0_9PEZI|nr:hypothetical protein O1611_g2159 [Lasiodiplodia mahajangana]
MPAKTVLITGCNQGGLGAAMAKVYRAKGFKVLATVRNAAKVGTLGETEGIEILELEVTSKESIQKCAATVEKLTGGTLDILVNNAGVGRVMPLLDLNLDEAKKVYDVNVWALVAMTQEFAPMLIKAKGIVCNDCGLRANGDLGTYNSSRSATTSISETLRIEMAPLGVRVVTAILGGIGTSGNDPDRKGELELPAGSHYQKLSNTINRYHKALVFTKKQNVDFAANNILNDVLRGGSIFIRRGEGSTLSWLAKAFLPHSLFTAMVNGESGLDELGS